MGQLYYAFLGFPLFIKALFRGPPTGSFILVCSGPTLGQHLLSYLDFINIFTWQGGVRKKIKDITSKIFLMDNLVD